MVEFRQVRKKPEILQSRFDGGLNTKDSPSLIDDTESPDCKNVDFGDRGSVKTRQGTSYYNTTAIGAFPGDGLTVYQNKMVVWGGGNMYYMSGTAAVPVTAASGKFASGVNVAYEQYQDILFCSDGVNGPWRYEGGQSFYNMGIGIPSAPTGFSSVAGANLVPTGTHYYAVAFVNSHAVAGQPGSASAGVTLATSASVGVSGIAVGSALQGVTSRRIYRSSQPVGPWNLATTLADNVTTSFTDVANTLGAAAITDGSSPKAFTTIKLHAERLWMDDKDDRTICRYTEYTDPFISESLSFLLMAEGGERQSINAIGVQNDLVSAFKDGEAIYVVNIGDASDDTTFQVIKSPANVGIAGPRAFVETDNGIVFMAKRKGQLVGIGMLQGLQLTETATPFVTNKMISRKIENAILNMPATVWTKICFFTYKNRIFIACPIETTSTKNDGMFLFDITRLVQDQDSNPGSWVPWDGVVGVNDMTNFNNLLYGISSGTDGKIIQFNNGTFTDAGSAAIDSYFWGKEIGADGDLETWMKDFRDSIPWIELLGSYNMNLCVRVDGVQGSGTCYSIDLTPNGSLWNTDFVWNVDTWGPGSTRQEVTLPIGPLLGKRIQTGFNNGNTAGQGFEVHSLKTIFNLRRQK